MKAPIGKRRTREHVIADLSINFVERQALLCGYTVARVRSDYGIDLEISTFNERGEMEPGVIRVQVKATDSLKVRPGHAEISCRIDRRDLVYWLSDFMPVVLSVFDARRTRGYGICMQQYFRELEGFNLFAAGKTITVRVPVANRITPAPFRKYAKLRDEFRSRFRGFES